ncbi:hypothetical protein NMY22_g7433 [Coprinellus aureogranulatus]|nr:hypothetical protein NMY22_g7433 [Coprinellus aureogranulatus]
MSAETTVTDPLAPWNRALQYIALITEKFSKFSAQTDDLEGRTEYLMEHAAGSGKEISRLAEENQKLQGKVGELEAKVEVQQKQIEELAETVAEMLRRF